MLNSNLWKFILLSLAPSSFSLIFLSISSVTIPRSKKRQKIQMLNMMFRKQLSGEGNLALVITFLTEHVSLFETWASGLETNRIVCSKFFFSWKVWIAKCGRCSLATYNFGVRVSYLTLFCQSGLPGYQCIRRVGGSSDHMILGTNEMPLFKFFL